MAKAKTPKTSSKVYVVKVTLKREPQIWRRIAIRGDQTLDDLHQAIFNAFDRDDEHLYSFYLPPPGSRGHNRLRKAPEYTHPSAAEEEGGLFGDEPAVYNAAETTVDSLQLRAHRRLEYLFDFGDEWWHELEVETVAGEADKKRYPRIIEKHGESPPQYPDLDDEEYLF